MTARLPIHLEPEEDESWLSYVRRASRAYVLPLSDAARRLGAVDGTGLLDLKCLKAPTEATRQRWAGDPDDLEAMFLSSFSHVFEVDGSGRRTRRKGAEESEWLTLKATKACPACLGEGPGHWRLTWYVPFVFMCLRHRVLLSGTCMDCGLQHFTPAKGIAFTLPNTMIVSDTSTCINLLHSETGRGTVRCGGDLARMPTVQISNVATILAQRTILDVLVAKRAPLAFGRRVTVSEWFCDLRSLIAWISSNGPADLASEHDPVVASAWRGRCERRDAGLRSTGGAPDPRAMAVATPVALEMLSLEKEAAAESISAMAMRMAGRRRWGAIYPRVSGGNSLWLRVVVHEATVELTKVVDMLGSHPLRPYAATWSGSIYVSAARFRERLPRTVKDMGLPAVMLGFSVIARFFQGGPKAYSLAGPDVPLEGRVGWDLIAGARRRRELRALYRLVLDTCIVRRKGATRDRDLLPSPGHRDSSMTLWPVDLRHLPSRYPREAYVDRFEEFFTDTEFSEAEARDYVAVVVAAAASGLSIPLVLDGLNRNVSRATVDFRHVDGVLASLRRRRALREAVWKEAQGLMSRGEPVDHGERRREIQKMAEIPWIDWVTISAVSGVPAGARRAHNRAAYGLLWTTLVGGDWRDAFKPVSDREAPELGTAQVQAFVDEAPTALCVALDEYTKYRCAARYEFSYLRYLERRALLPFEPRHVPQLFPRDEYLNRFRQFFVGLEAAEGTARGALSVILLGTIDGRSRVELTSALGFDPRRANGGVGRASRLVQQQDGFDDAWRSFLTTFVQSPDKVDYGARRERWQNLHEVPWDDWNQLCSASGVASGARHGPARTYAAAWLWSELTQGDAVEAPALSKSFQERKRNVVKSELRQFLTSDLPKLRDALVEWAGGRASE